ncbi:MAG: UDP-N-acetylglucosamine 2-epimerase, partial [Ferruginibacter sp.]|nr:UDP-N-acetylglucosamine 2-epimerase [Ferruginibacter sp.]
ERVIKMGEQPGKVFLTGCPSIDLAEEILQSEKLDFDVFKKYGGVGKDLNLSNGYIVVMQHPVTTEYDQSRAHIHHTLTAIHQLNIPTLWFWPNVDAGADGTSKGIRVFREQNDCSNLHFFKNMEPDHFLKLLNGSQCLVGNSSVGIRECAYLGVPVVNIGSRQAGRERGQNVIDTGYSTQEVTLAINQQIKHGHYKPDKIYGDATAGIQIANILAKEALSFDKKLSY